MLSAISLAAFGGEIIGVVGPSGSGKTSLFRVLYGQEKPSFGSVFFLQKPLRDRSKYSVRYLQQEHTFSSRDRVMSTLIDQARDLGSTREQANEMALVMCRELALDDVNVRLGALPTALRRMCELAMVLIGAPPLVLLDMPLGPLGSKLSRLAIGWIGRAAQRGSCVLVAECRTDLLESLVTRVIVLKTGRVVHDGRPGAVAEVGASGAYVIRTNADFSSCPFIQMALPIGRDTRITLSEGATREQMIGWVLEQQGTVEMVRPARSLADVLTDIDYSR